MDKIRVVQLGYRVIKYSGINSLIRKQNNNIADHILQTACMIQDNEFVQAMIHMKGKSPSIIPYTTQQMAFFVTTTVYRCHSVVRRAGENTSIFLGSMYLDWNESYETYHSFFSHNRMKLNISEIQVNLANLYFGSDEEKALRKAVSNCFPESVQVLCSLHMKKTSTITSEIKSAYPKLPEHQSYSRYLDR